jgi:hypothetical protein
MGGWTVDTYVSENESYANKIAAVAAIQPAGMDNPVSQMGTFASTGGSWWGIRGASDIWGTEVPTIVSTMNAVVPGSARSSTVSAGETSSTHCCWNTFYDPLAWINNPANSFGESLYEWMLKQAQVVNQPPVISFGPLMVTLSANVTDSDGTIASYAWTKVSGGSATITTPSSASTSVTGLGSGTYIFRLTATDDQGGSTSRDIQFTL